MFYKDLLEFYKDSPVTLENLKSRVRISVSHEIKKSVILTCGTNMISVEFCDKENCNGYWLLIKPEDVKHVRKIIKRARY